MKTKTKRVPAWSYSQTRAALEKKGLCSHIIGKAAGRGGSWVEPCRAPVHFSRMCVEHRGQLTATLVSDVLLGLVAFIEWVGQ